MAKKIIGLIKLQIPAGKAKSSSPIGPALSQHGLNIAEFCKAFNAQTKSIEPGLVLPVVLKAFADKSFTFVFKPPPASAPIKKGILGAKPPKAKELTIADVAASVSQDKGDPIPGSAEPPRQPVLKRPPVLFDKTQEVLARIEERLGAPVLVYWNSGGGAVCDNDVLGLYELLHHAKRLEKVYIFIKSDGGNGQASLRMVHLLREFADHVCALVPLECLSAATMIALGADKILMGPIARLSAVDTSLRHDLSPLDRENDRVSVSQNEVERILRSWKNIAGNSTAHPFEALFQHVHPLVIGAVDRASMLSIRLCEEILAYHMTDTEAIRRISNTLNSDYPAHSYPITAREAQRIGLNVEHLSAEVNDELLALNRLYSEMGQSAITDFDENNQHNNRILNILERNGLQVFYQVDKDWRYRPEERRWISLNDESSWHRVVHGEQAPQVSKIHIS